MMISKKKKSIGKLSNQLINSIFFDRDQYSRKKRSITYGIAFETWCYVYIFNEAL